MISRPSLDRVLGLILMLCAILPPGASRADYALFDFEQPYFVEELNVQCKDHALVRSGDTFHVFYIHSFPPGPGENLRSEKWLGHLTSADLKHWARQDSILPVAEVPGTWEGKYIWAPKVVKSPSGHTWYLFYTGVDANIVQQVGMAWSFDLFAWNRWPMSPVYHPGAWAAWNPGTWSNCRDPEIFRLSEGNPYYMLNTASTNQWYGAISLASSTDLATWTDLGPLFVNNSVQVLESPQLVYENGLYHLFFTEQYVQGTSHMYSPTMTGAWTKDNLTVIDAGNAPEVSRLVADDYFSRHDAFLSVDGPRYFFRFDKIDLSTPDNVPEVLSLSGLGDDWNHVFGSAFDNQPTWGDNPHERGEVSSNMEGNSYISTYENFPDPYSALPGSVQGGLVSGMISSRSFTVTGNRMSLIVGGGHRPERCFVGLLQNSNGNLRFLETGQNSFAMDLRIWNTSSLIGQTVSIVVADLGFTSDWDHISVDSIKEYFESGVDPFPPSEPLNPGPRLNDILADAGFPNTSAPGEPIMPARLLAPHPNPFNPRTHLRYEIDRAGMVELLVIDSSGRLARRLFSGRLDPGPGYFLWDGRDDGGGALPSGCYFARLTLDGRFVGSQKLILVR